MLRARTPPNANATNDDDTNGDADRKNHDAKKYETLFVKHRGGGDEERKHVHACVDFSPRRPPAHLSTHRARADSFNERTAVNGN